jgi:hypothetical protein
MAETFSAKLAATDADSDKALKVLGLQNPVVARSDDVEDEKYHRELAKELGAVLLGQSSVAERQPALALMVQGDPKRELIGLDEVWCLWNRARGVGELAQHSDSHLRRRLLLKSCDGSSRITAGPSQCRNASARLDQPTSTAP